MDDGQFIFFEEYEREVEELECTFTGDVIDALDDDCKATLAMESQKLGRAAPYHEARRRLNTQRTDRSHGLKAKFTGTGSVTFTDKDAQRRLDELKRTARCDDCGEVGQWAGDAQCTSPCKRQRSDATSQPKGASKKGAGKGRGTAQQRGTTVS